MVRHNDDTKEFGAHEDQLCKSPYFDEALKKARREGQPRKIEIRDGSPEDIQQHLHFLYTKQLSKDLISNDWALF